MKPKKRERRKKAKNGLPDFLGIFSSKRENKKTLDFQMEPKAKKKVTKTRQEKKRNKEHTIPFIKNTRKGKEASSTRSGHAIGKRPASRLEGLFENESRVGHKVLVTNKGAEGVVQSGKQIEESVDRTEDMEETELSVDSLLSQSQSPEKKESPKKVQKTQNYCEFESFLEELNQANLEAMDEQAQGKFTHFCQSRTTS